MYDFKYSKSFMDLPLSLKYHTLRIFSFIPHDAGKALNPFERIVKFLED